MSRSERKTRRKNRGHEDAANAEAPLRDGAAPAVETAESMPATDLPAIATRDLAKDIATIDAAEWPHLDWPAAPGERSGEFQVIVKRSVLNAIHRHGQTTSEVEVCGVLVGNVVRDASGPFLIIEASIRGDFAGNSSAQVTFTAETWSHIQGVMEQEHPDQRIVGWYHTHPGFGIFLSDMDLFIHGNFFNLPWQVAMVHDPSSGEDGLFLWRDGKAERGPFIVDEDAEKEIVAVPVSAELTAAALADFSRRMQGMEKRQKVMLVGGLFVAMIALTWPFILFTILADRRVEARGPAQSGLTDATSGAPATGPSSRAPTALAAIAHLSSPTTEPSSDASPPAAVVAHVLPATTQSILAANPVANPVTQPADRIVPPAIIRIATTLPAATDERIQSVPQVLRPATQPSTGPRVIETP